MSRFATSCFLDNRPKQNLTLYENPPLLKLSNWYRSNCNGDWEYDYGIKIETLDNPGWRVEIEFAGTDLFAKDVAWSLTELSGDDWFGFKVEDGTYIASGDPSKLEFLIEHFFTIVQAK